MSDEKKFRVWLFRERGWEDGDAGRRLPTTYDEPAEAADQAEASLRTLGIPGQSYAELRLNGDKMPHTVICLLEDGKFGIWNTEVSQWPIFYPPEDQSGTMLAEFPFGEAQDGSQWNEQDEADSKQKSDEGDMRLDEIENDSGEEEDDEEFDAESEEDSGEDAEDDSDDTSDESDGHDDSDDAEDSDEGQGEDEDGKGNSVDDEGDDETEVEMPRLGIFAKFRGPLGWRKRAEAEELQETNKFALKLGILDPEAEKTGQQEREIFAQVEFIESDVDREAGLLRLKLPEGVEFKQGRRGWIEARIPYRKDDDA